MATGENNLAELLFSMMKLKSELIDLYCDILKITPEEKDILILTYEIDGADSVLDFLRELYKDFLKDKISKKDRTN